MADYSERAPPARGKDGGRAIAEDLERLSPRHQDVLALVAEGMSNKQIAIILGISRNTVKSYVEEIQAWPGAYGLDAQLAPERIRNEDTYSTQIDGSARSGGHSRRRDCCLRGSRALNSGNVATAFDPPVANPTLYAVPSFSETPAPNATPDRTKPNWYGPLLNADRDLPKFDGEVNGIKVGPALADETDPSSCGGVRGLVGEEARVSASTGPLGINYAALPAGLQAVGSPRVTACQDGIRMVQQTFQVAPGTRGANAGGGSVDIFRIAGGTRAGVSAPQARWTSGTLLNHPAAFLRPVVERPVESTLGESAVAVATGVGKTTQLTLVYGRAISPDLARSIAEAVLK